MANKLWKHVEREIAKLFGGTRNPITGRVRDKGLPDIEHDKFSIEVKHRESLPSWLVDAMDQAIQSKRSPEHIPIVVLHQKGVKYEDSIVLIAVKDLLSFYQLK